MLNIGTMIILTIQRLFNSVIESYILTRRIAS